MKKNVENKKEASVPFHDGKTNCTAEKTEKSTAGRVASFFKQCGHFIKIAAVVCWMKVCAFFKLMYGNKKSAVGFSILLFFILLALVIAPLLNYDGTVDAYNMYGAMSWKNLFGTDSMGRDVLSMLIIGTKNILVICVLTAVITVTVGTLLGLLSGLMGGWVDKIIQTITNLFLTIPSFPVLMLIAAMMTITNNALFALILSLWNWPGLCRAVRSQIITLKERDFIQICKVMKMSKWHIVTRELLPNIWSYIFINFVMIMKNAIIASVGIMMIGAVPYEATNWGAMLQSIMSELALHSETSLGLILGPILFVFLFQFAVIMLAHGLDEKLNPRLRRN